MVVVSFFLEFLHRKLTLLLSIFIIIQITILTPQQPFYANFLKTRHQAHKRTLTIIRTNVSNQGKNKTEVSWDNRRYGTKRTSVGPSVVFFPWYRRYIYGFVTTGYENGTVHWSCSPSFMSSVNYSFDTSFHSRVDSRKRTGQETQFLTYRFQGVRMEDTRDRGEKKRYIVYIKQV